MIKAEHAGDTCSAFSDVVNFVVGRTQDFAGSAVVVDVPGVRQNDSEHFYTSVGRINTAPASGLSGCHAQNIWL